MARLPRLAQHREREQEGGAQGGGASGTCDGDRHHDRMGRDIMTVKAVSRGKFRLASLRAVSGLARSVRAALLISRPRTGQAIKPWCESW
jgi:hypothetical protein